MLSVMSNRGFHFGKPFLKYFCKVPRSLTFHSFTRQSSINGINFARHSSTNYSNFIQVNPNVKEALNHNHPLVALETALVTHGLSFPFNIQTAIELENIIKEEGAFPATIGVLKGKIVVGLTKSELEFLANNSEKCRKVSRRDFPYVLANKISGGTTVSGTMLVAHMVGIPLFVTGGIGGVHRGAEKTLDVSADLVELGRTPVTVVSAGVKSILDVGRTLEYLETLGVSVASLGDSCAFPDFFTRDSGFRAPYHVEDCLSAAEMMFARKKLELMSGMLFAVPIPRADEPDGLLIKKAVEQALVQAETEVAGCDVTPFVLKKVAELTEGKSVVSNINLIRNNAKHGARIAVEYSKLISGEKRKIRIESIEDESKITKAPPVC